MEQKLNYIIILLITLNLTNIDLREKLSQLKVKVRNLENWAATHLKSIKQEKNS